MVVIEMDNIMVSLFLLVCVLASCSKGQVTGTCGAEELRRAAVSEGLASVGCDSYLCSAYKLQPGLDPRNPAGSCTEILSTGLDYNAPSDYYWLRSSNGSAVRVFCDMTFTCKGVGGGWMQVAKLDMTNISHQCPPGTRLRMDLLQQRRVCGINLNGAGCSSSVFTVHGIEYGQVCGKIIAYQDASPDTFQPSSSIDSNYVDGISLTHGSNPRKHIWTFAGGLDEVGTFPVSNCPCTNVDQAASASQPPSFVGNDYFCDTGSTNRWERRFYPDDPLWDGAGCGPTNVCCSLNNPPWFLKQLPSNTTDDVEMRMCRNQGLVNGRIDEDTPIEVLEIYVK